MIDEVNSCYPTTAWRMRLKKSHNVFDNHLYFEQCVAARVSVLDKNQENAQIVTCFLNH